eukprot:1191563-Prorocentrum_minimum.AAC.4
MTASTTRLPLCAAQLQVILDVLRGGQQHLPAKRARPWCPGLVFVLNTLLMLQLACLFTHPI